MRCCASIDGRRFVLVSSPYHMRRAILVWRKQAPGVDVVPSPVPQSEFYAHVRGASAEQVRGIFQEYLANRRLLENAAGCERRRAQAADNQRPGVAGCTVPRGGRGRNLGAGIVGRQERASGVLSDRSRTGTAARGGLRGMVCRGCRCTSTASSFATRANTALPSDRTRSVCSCSETR